MSRLLLLVLLVGCAGNQSALPMPPVFSPVEDAPIFIGQPGTVAPEPEKSPHKRLLPQTPESRRETGVWAGDGPSASNSAGARIWDVEIPLPRPEDAVLVDVKTCTTPFTDALYRRPDLLMAAKQPPSDRKYCMAVEVFSACMREAAASPEDAARILKHVASVTAKRCASLRDEMDQLVSAVLIEVVKPTPEGNGGGRGLH